MQAATFTPSQSWLNQQRVSPASSRSATSLQCLCHYHAAPFKPTTPALEGNGDVGQIGVRMRPQMCRKLRRIGIQRRSAARGLAQRMQREIRRLGGRPLGCFLQNVCAYVPPTPLALIAACRGWTPRGHAVSRSLTENGLPSNPIARLVAS